MIVVPKVVPTTETHGFRTRDERAAFTREVGSGAFGSPLVGMVVDGFAKAAVSLILGGTIAKDVRHQGADHLRVAVVTTLGNVDVASGQFERRVGHLETLFDIVGAIYSERWDDLNNTADGDRHENEHGEGKIVFNQTVEVIRP